MDEQGSVYLEGQELTPDQLEMALRKAWANNPTHQEVVIRGDKRSRWQSIVMVMNLCNKANIRNYKTAIAD